MPTKNAINVPKLTIVAVPLSERKRKSINDETLDYSSNKRYYGRMPALYLEFIENKNRIRPELLKPHLSRKRFAPMTNGTGDHRTQESFDRSSQRSHLPIGQNIGTTAFSSNQKPLPQNASNTASSSSLPNNDIRVSATSQSVEGTNAASSTMTIDDHNHPDPPSFEELRAKGLTGGITQQSKKSDGTLLGSGPIVHPLDDTEDAAKERDDLNFKYQVLKRMHPNANIPEMTIYSDPKIMAQKYRDLSKSLSLDSSVESWKRYMIIAIMGSEVLLGKMNFDMEGFAQQQIASMNTYDKLLLELAQKSYVSEDSKWPVELRLVGTILVNVVFFVVAKMIAKRTGFDFLDIVNTSVGIGSKFSTHSGETSSSANDQSSSSGGTSTNDRQQSSLASSSSTLGRGGIPVDKIMRAP